MNLWPPFEINGVRYVLDHLRATTLTAVRPASSHFASRSIRVFIIFSDHCFTAHTAVSEKWVYPYSIGRHKRYFCHERYSCSKHLPELVIKLINDNAILGRTLHQHHETFFYLEEYFMGVDYRLFFEITQSQHPCSEIRLKVTTAYPLEKWAAPVGTTGRFSFWHIFDARLNGLKLPTRRR